ncbi:MAG: hypothetical protein ACRC6B_05240 [Fusobacteriaceae bacterium]
MFKRGKKVWYAGIGWGVVTIVDSQRNYPVEVKFEHNDLVRSFKEDGKLSEYDKNSSLFLEEILIPKEAMLGYIWRAKETEGYWHINAYGITEYRREGNCFVDRWLHEARNYFKTEESALESELYEAFEKMKR